jgi:RNA-directed DNA polymerase
MSQLSALRAARTRKDLANILGFKLSALVYVLYKIDDSKKYRVFDIPKKKGGFRKISAPFDQLCLLQRRLCDVLQNCSDEIQANKNRDILSHGFKRQRSIMTNAKIHKNRRFVFNIDLEDFFGSINFGRVRGFFIHNRDFELDPNIATLIAQIACFDNKLPQGSPCSPVISNLISHILDIHINKLTRQAGCSYSRYADDITISTNKLSFPSTIAFQDEQGWHPTGELNEVIERNGFKINSVKTGMQYYFSRQEVTGLVVNKKINVPRDYRHKVRAMVHSLLSNGEFELGHIVDQGSQKIIQKIPGNISQLHGMLGYIYAVDMANRARTGDLDTSPSSTTMLYRRFLLYKEFFTAKRPVVICEGKTDNVYITQAIRQLAAAYPELATQTQDDQIEIKIRRFRYTESSTGRVLGIRGGAGDLKNFILHYAKEAQKVEKLTMEHPVILLVDNDDASKPIFSIANEILKGKKKKGGKKKAGEMVDASKEFTNVIKNLYLVAVPSQGQESAEIEDLFDQKARDRKIGTRVFSPDSNADENLYYGKSDFAYKVVMKHANELDFSGFRVLLDRFVSVIQHHRDKLIDF